MTAPKLEKKVSQIIEWMQLDGEVIKANTSYFNKAGKLTGYYNKDDKKGEKIIFEYDDQGRVVKKTIGTDEASAIKQFEYEKNKVVWEEHFRGKVFRGIEFKNEKGQLVEKKTYLKGGEMGEKFILRERYIFSYNAQDSLKGIKHYAYSLDGSRKGKSYETKKTLFYYESKTGKRSRISYFDVSEEEVKNTQYEYHKDGRLKKVTLSSTTPYENNRIIEYHYNNDGTLWQEIEKTAYKRFVKIYKKGRLIRQRTYIGEELFTIVDFQYVFY